jgi:hypothetical protein
MSFLPFQYANGVTPWEYLPADAITPKVGMLLEFNTSTGRLKVCSQGIPQYISMAEHSSDVSAGTLIPVIKIEKDTVYETQLDGDVSSLALGTLADIDTTGLLLDGDASTDDVFRVEYVGGLTEGSTVRGKFVK